jgi:hypothetical protein
MLDGTFAYHSLRNHMLSPRVVSSRKLVDVGGQEVSRSKSDDTGDVGVDDLLWLDKTSGDVVCFDDVLAVCMARCGVVLYLA